MKKNLFFYLNKILYNEAVENTQQTQQNIQTTSNSINTVKTVIDQKFKNLFNQGGDTSSNIKNFFNNISEKGDKNILNKIINRLERKKDPETDEDRFINSKVDELNKNSELKNSIIKFIKTNSDLDLEELKQKFEKEDFISKKNLFKQILSQIKYFQNLPENEKNRIIETYSKELVYDTVENVVKYFLKDEAKKSIIRNNAMNAKKTTMLNKNTPPQQGMPQQKMMQQPQGAQPPQQTPK